MTVEGAGDARGERLLDSITHVARQLECDASTTLASSGLTLSQFNALTLIADNPTVGYIVLASRMRISRQAFSMLVHRLESTGLLERQRKPFERRSVVRPTTRGWLALKAARPLVAAAESRVEAAIGETRLDVVRHALRDLEAEFSTRENSIS